MNERYCAICEQYFTGNGSTLEISDDKGKFQISGHDSCVDELHEKFKAIKDVHKTPLDKVLKLLNLKR